MEYDYFSLGMFACGLAFVVITRLHLAYIGSRASANRSEMLAQAAAITPETSSETNQESPIRMRPSTPMQARGPVAATRLVVKPSQTPGSSHAA